MTAMHITFVASAYGFAAAILFALIAWVALDYRAQKRRLADLESRRGQP